MKFFTFFLMLKLCMGKILYIQSYKNSVFVNLILSQYLQLTQRNQFTALLPLMLNPNLVSDQFPWTVSTKWAILRHDFVPFPSKLKIANPGTTRRVLFKDLRTVLNVNIFLSLTIQNNPAQITEDLQCMSEHNSFQATTRYNY